MKKTISLILAAVIVIALLIMGIMEKTLSATVGNKGIIIFYIILAIILAVFYMRAKKAADAEKENENSDADEDTNDSEK